MFVNSNVICVLGDWPMLVIFRISIDAVILILRENARKCSNVCSNNVWSGTLRVPPIELFCMDCTLGVFSASEMFTCWEDLGDSIEPTILIFLRHPLWDGAVGLRCSEPNSQVVNPATNSPVNLTNSAGLFLFSIAIVLIRGFPVCAQ